jgi:hypothetical protein
VLVVAEPSRLARPICRPPRVITGIAVSTRRRNWRPARERSVSPIRLVGGNGVLCRQARLPAVEFECLIPPDLRFTGQNF